MKPYNAKNVRTELKGEQDETTEEDTSQNVEKAELEGDSIATKKKVLFIAPNFLDIHFEMNCVFVNELVKSGKYKVVS